jgi:hypothetical protein
MYDDGSDCSSTGILVCIPMHHNFEFYKHLLSNYCLLDGDLLDILWFPYKSDLKYHIPIEYSINILKDNFDEFKTHLPKIYGLHFCGDLKPWNFKNVEEYIEAFNKIVPYDSIFRDDVFKWYFIHYINPL